MTNSNSVTATHTKTHQDAVSLKTQAGSPKLDISKSKTIDYGTLTQKDGDTLIKKANKLLSDYHARIMVSEAPESILSFYENNADKILGKVVIVRTKDDEGMAAHVRNTCDKVLFVFGDRYFVSSYFSGVCSWVKLSKALIDRASK